MGCFESKDTSKKEINKTDKRKLVLKDKWRQLLQVTEQISFMITNSHGSAQHPSFKSIQKDIHRTFPQQVRFQSAQNLASFQQILKCYALTFPKMGYTQGLNFVAGYLILNQLSQSQVLSTLVRLSTHPQLMLIGLYEDNFPLTHFYCRLFWKLLAKCDKQLFNKVKDIQLPDYMWIFQWFITIYVYSFPLQYVTQFFTFICQYRNLPMVLLAVSIVISLRKHIIALKQKDQFDFCQLLDNLKNYQKCKQLLKIKDVIKFAKSISEKIILESLEQIKNQQKVMNFYVKYFCGNKDEKKVLYQLFMQQIQQRNVCLTNSIHDTILMNSYKRNQENVQILDEILLESIKRLKNKKYKSDMDKKFQSKIQQKHQKKWKSLAFIQQDQNDHDTTISIVKKVNLD